MPSFIMTGTNKTGRIDPAITDPSIIGLSTSALRTCVAVVIIGEKSKRISLTHHVGGLERDYSSILQEIVWVGSPFIIRLAKNTAGMQAGLSEISAQLDIKTEADFKKYDTERLIIQFLRENGLIKNIQTRKDTASGEIFVTREGQLITSPSEDADLKFADDRDFRNAVEMMNNVYSKVLVSPRIEFDGKQFLDQMLIQPALYVLNLIAYQLKLMECEMSLGNVYLALKIVDGVLKGIGSATGARLEVYGQEPSERRNQLLDDIKRIITSGKMQIVSFPKSITDKMEASIRVAPKTKLTP